MTALMLVFFFVLVLLVGMEIGWLVFELVHHSIAGAQHLPAPAPAVAPVGIGGYQVQGFVTPKPAPLEFAPDASAALGPLEFGGAVIHRSVTASPYGGALGPGDTQFKPGTDCEILLEGGVDGVWALATVKDIWTQAVDGRPRYICELWHEHMDGELAPAGRWKLQLVDEERIRPMGGPSVTI